MRRPTLGWSLLIVANALLWCVLSLDGASEAAPLPARQPFGNAVEQRGEMIRHLNEIKNLLKEQNRLLRAEAGQAAIDDSSQR